MSLVKFCKNPINGHTQLRFINVMGACYHDGSHALLSSLQLSLAGTQCKFEEAPVKTFHKICRSFTSIQGIDCAKISQMSTCGCHDDTNMDRNEKKESRNTNTTNHPDVSRLGKRARDADEEGGENEKGSEVHGDDRPESQTLNSMQLK